MRRSATHRGDQGQDVAQVRSMVPGVDAAWVQGEDLIVELPCRGGCLPAASKWRMYCRVSPMISAPSGASRSPVSLALAGRVRPPPGLNEAGAPGSLER